MNFISRPEIYTQKMSYIYKYAKLQNKAKTQTAAVIPDIRIKNNQFLGYLLS